MLALCPPLLHVPIQPLAMDYIIIIIIIIVQELENFNFHLNLIDESLFF